jgi:hypothetical protein
VTAVAESALLGNQTPRFSSVPPYSVSLGDDAVAFAAKAGLFLDPWQQMVLRESMGMAPGGKWSAPQVGLLVPRQNGKGSVLEALELFHLFVLNTKLIIHSAHKFDTSQEHFLRMRTLIEGNPDLARHVASTPTANGKEAIILRNGNRLKFKARTISGAGRGFSSDLLILDEAMLLPEQALDAMMPTLTARKNPQVWFTSSAGTPDSAALWRIVKRGRDKAPRLAYFEWGCESGADATDRRNWAAANPGFGHRLSLDALEDDFALLSEDGFAREHLGIWDDVASGIFPPNAWESLADPQAPRGTSPVFAVSTAPDRSWSAVAVAWRRPDGLPQVMLSQSGPGRPDYRPDAMRSPTGSARSSLSRSRQALNRPVDRYSAAKRANGGRSTSGPGWTAPRAPRAATSRRGRRRPGCRRPRATPRAGRRCGGRPAGAPARTGARNRRARRPG